MKGKCEWIIVVVFVLLTCQVYNQTLHPSLIAQQANISSFSRLHPDLLSSISNPASLNSFKTSALAIAAERRYLLKELNNYTMTAGIVLPAGHFSIAGNYAGFAGYHESIVSLGYARTLGKKIDAGLQLKYYQFRQGGGYGSSSVPGFVLGTIWHVNEKLHTGIVFERLVQMRYEWGIGYEASDQFLFSLMIIKEEQQPVNILCGIRYSPMKKIYFKAGVNSAIASPWFAAGIALSQIKLEIFSAWHPQLGVTPGMILLFEQGSKQ